MGLLESHKCLANCNNVYIDFTHNLAYPKPQASALQQKPKPILLQTSSKCVLKNETKEYPNFSCLKENKSLETPTQLHVSTQETNLEGTQCHENWTRESIKLLICAYVENKEKFLSPMYNKKKVWENISQTLLKNNVLKSGIKCDEKWRNLKKTYEKVLAEKQKTGGQPVFWEFFNDFQDIYVSDPRYEPVAVASSSGLFKKRNIDECLEKNSDEKVIENTPKKCKKQIVTETERRQQRHEEKMAFKREVFNWFKEKFPSPKKD